MRPGCQGLVIEYHCLQIGLRGRLAEHPNAYHHGDGDDYRTHYEQQKLLFSHFNSPFGTKDVFLCQFTLTFFTTSPCHSLFRQ